jgi:hypothetical protein
MQDVGEDITPCVIIFSLSLVKNNFLLFGKLYIIFQHKQKYFFLGNSKFIKKDVLGVKLLGYRAEGLQH